MTNDRVNGWTEVFDEKALQIVGRLGACIASLPSAWFVSDASHRQLQVPAPVSWIIAAVIELLGIGLADMAITCHVWNQDEERRAYWRAPVIIPILSYTIYLIATIGITVFLKALPDLARVAPVLFPFLAVAGAVNWSLLKVYNMKIVGLAQAREIEALARGRAEEAEALARERAEELHREELRQKRQERHERRLERMRLQNELEKTRVPGDGGEISGDGQWGAEVTGLTPRMQEHADRLRDTLSDNGGFVVAEASRVLGVSTRQTRNVIRALRQSGVLTGTDQKNRYDFAEEEREEVS